ncbi:hypothetical protein [Sphingobacterium sp.]|uniref:hypothetical protein n=1 Tax=Sphingobacterium sp. TaxID=341027 RepID=UPI002898BB9D|nr:hypothetical protein [Sphingobacterium sp.]
MANWCMNTVAFEGSPEALEQIQQLFKTMAEKERKEDCGQLPDFVSDETEVIFLQSVRTRAKREFSSMKQNGRPILKRCNR